MVSILSYMTIYNLLMKWGIQEVKRNLCKCIPRRNHTSLVNYSFNVTITLNISYLLFYDEQIQYKFQY